MAWTQADLDAIDAEIANPESSSRFQDRERTGRSVEELLKQRAIIAASLGESGEAPRTVRMIRVYSNKGH